MLTRMRYGGLGVSRCGVFIIGMVWRVDKGGWVALWGTCMWAVPYVY